jgi:beta-lactam-binding protein with PASTA domain
MKAFLRAVLLLLVLAAVALVSALTAMRFAVHGREVTVPNLVGLAPTDARRATADLGLEVEVERQFYSPDIPIGRIVSQAPAAGATVRRGWHVRVAESLGQQRVSPPNVLGQTQRTAELNIRRRGMQLGNVAVAVIPDSPAGQVIAQDPSASAVIVTSPALSLLVAAPSQPQSYVMPSFVGQPLATATQALGSVGMKVGSVTTAQAPPGDASPPAPVTPGSLITSQTPAAGERVVAGQTVNFEVSR